MENNLSRECLHLRWEKDNALLINGGIHLFKFHKYPHIHREFVVSKIGEEKAHKFELMSKVRCSPLYTCEIRLIKQRLKEELKAL